MFKRYLLPALIVVAVAAPAYAQRKDRGGDRAPAPTKASPAFLALFKPAVESREPEHGPRPRGRQGRGPWHRCFGDGYVLTKASEVKAGRVSVKTRDGRDFDAQVTTTSEGSTWPCSRWTGPGSCRSPGPRRRTAPVGNWLAIPGMSPEPVAVGVVSTAPRTPPPPYGPPRVPTEQSGFLGVTLDPEAAGATIYQVTAGGAAEKAGHPGRRTRSC